MAESAEITADPTTESANDNDVVRTRAAIRAVARSANLDAAWADAQIDREATVEQARAAAFEALTTRGMHALRTHVGVSAEDPAVVSDRMAEALASRMTGAAPSDAARPYAAMGLHDMARAMLTRAGVGVATLGREELLTRAMHTVSDFPNLLTATGNRVLLPAYQAAQSPLKALARQTTAADFRPLSRLKLGEFGPLKEVTESGEITATTTGEAVDSYSLLTFGRLFALSRKALINDDLGAFARWAEMMGRAAAEMEAGQLLGLLMASTGLGPLMGDGKRLFDAAHGNLAGTPDLDGVSIPALTKARLAMRKQKGLDGTTPIGVTPKYLLVSPDQETVAEQVLAELYPTKAADTNPFSGKLELMVEPRLTGNAWYVFADPASAPVIEYAYLANAQGPQLSSRDGWEVLGREFRCYEDFGCGAIDFRGAYRNAGA